MVTGLTAQQGANQFIVIGVMSLVSSILAGRIMDNKTVNPFHVNQAAALVMATSLFLTQLANEYYHFMIFSAVFGSGVGAYYTTMEVLYINTGNKKLLKYAWPTAETLPSIGKGVGPPFIGMNTGVLSLRFMCCRPFCRPIPWYAIRCHVVSQAAQAGSNYNLSVCAIYHSYNPTLFPLGILTLWLVVLWILDVLAT